MEKVVRFGPEITTKAKSTAGHTERTEKAWVKDNRRFHHRDKEAQRRRGRKSEKDNHHQDPDARRMAAKRRSNCVGSAVACSGQRFEDEGTELDDVACAESENEVTGLRRTRSRVRRVGE